MKIYLFNVLRKVFGGDLVKINKFINTDDMQKYRGHELTKTEEEDILTLALLEVSI